MRDCENGDMRDVLPDWVHGRLDAGRAAAVAAHVAGCADCAEEVTLLRDLGASLTAAAPRVNVAAIVAALPKARAHSTIRWFQRTQWRAAAAVLFMTGVSVAVFNRAPSKSPDMIVASSIEFAGGVSDLSDRDLTTLLAEIDQLEATPSAEPDDANAVSTDLGRVTP